MAGAGAGDGAGRRARLKALRSSFERSRIDGLLVSDLKNARYLSGFTGSSAYVIVTRDEALLLTDPRYTTQARQEVRGLKVRIFKKALDEIAGAVKGLGIRSLGFEAESLSFETYGKLGKALPAGARLRPTAGLVRRLRQRKDKAEVGLLRSSAALLDEGFTAAMGLIRPGVVEREAALSVEAKVRGRGAEAMAFDSIIASGARGALPHGKASAKRVKRGEFVVVDMGVLKDGYNSDETRTFVVGPPGARHKEIYRVVSEAQASAIEAIRPGARASDVDAAARRVIAKAGYGRYFGHGTGHGVGLDVHEGPSLSPVSEDVLEEGMVVTVEPGIYMPGWGGVRIEDMALVVKGGCELLTSTVRDLVRL